MLNSIQTKASNSFVAFHGYSAAVCKLRNTSSVSIDYRVGGTVAALAAGASAVIDPTASTSEVEVRRTDLSATPVSVMLDFGVTSDEAYELATAATLAHDRDPAAHLNTVRRTLSANLTLTAVDYQRQNIVPDADRDVILPAEGTSRWAFLLCHAGASYNITVKRAGGTTVGVLIPGSSLAVAWDGTGIVLC